MRASQIHRIKLHSQLCEALRDHDLDKAMHCLNTGAKPDDDGTGTGHNPGMHVAAEHGFIPGMEMLWRAGADVNAKAGFQYTPLMYAAKHGKVEAGRWLLEHGACALAVNAVYERVLSIALDQNHLDFAQMLIEQRPHEASALVDAAARKAASAGSLSAIVQWLLDHGASPDTPNHDGKPWIMAAQSTILLNTEPVTEMLLKAGANVNQRSLIGETALHEAAKRKNLGPFIRLLRAGADPDLPDQSGWTVRAWLEEEPMLSELHDAFVAWEASEAAQQILRGASTPSSLRPL